MLTFTGLKGRAFSMTRLDQLAKPKRRNGEHISAIIERERRQALELENMSKMSMSKGSPSSHDRRKSRSMSQLGGRFIPSRDGSRQSQVTSPLQIHHKNNDATRSMTQLTNGAEKRLTPAKAGWKSKFHGLNHRRIRLKRLEIGSRQLTICSLYHLTI